MNLDSIGIPTKVKENEKGISKVLNMGKYFYKSKNSWKQILVN